MIEKFDIKDLYVVKIKEDLIDKLGISKEFINYFKSNIYYIVEKFSVHEDKIKYFEIYKECIVGQDFYKRIGTGKVITIPNMFEEINPIPEHYFDEEELKEGTVTTPRLFQIFEEINYSKVKKISRKRK